MMKGLNGYVVVTDYFEEGYGVLVGDNSYLNASDGDLVFWNPTTVLTEVAIDGTSYVFIRELDLIGKYSVEEDS